MDKRAKAEAAIAGLRENAKRYPHSGVGDCFTMTADGLEAVLEAGLGESVPQDDDYLTMELKRMLVERDCLIADRDAIAAERDRLREELDTAKELAGYADVCAKADRYEQALREIGQSAEKFSGYWSAGIAKAALAKGT